MSEKKRESRKCYDINDSSSVRIYMPERMKNEAYSGVA